MFWFERIRYVEGLDVFCELLQYLGLSALLLLSLAVEPGLPELGELFALGLDLSTASFRHSVILGCLLY
jgi:hypothetical protein